VNALRTRFVVTGCSRSGTTYASELFTAAGFSCGHERVFNILRVVDGSVLPAPFRGHEDRDGDSSWLAAPYLGSLPPGSVVLHQVRHPLEVTRSHLGIRYFADPMVLSMYLADNHHDFLDVVRRFTPAALSSPDELDRCIAYWVEWNRLAERAATMNDIVYVRYRVEEMTPGLFRRLVRLVDSGRDDHLLDRVVESVPRTVNTRPRAPALDWAALPDTPLKREAARMARSYGYDCPV